MKNNLLYISFFIVVLLVFLLGYRQFFNSNIHPLSNTWEIAISNQEIPEGLTSLSAESCGVCHIEHYDEWKTSTHAHAWTDVQFQAELAKETSPFMCINCHIPLQNQQEYFIRGLIDGDLYQPVKERNPHFDQKLRQEGINCASCHVRNNVIIGPTGSKMAPHKTVKDKVFLSEKLCISCHNANAVVTPTLACTFQTGDEWKAGPYFGRKNCISCHMDTISREIMIGYGKKIGHRHFFPGSGIPKSDTLKANILNGLEFYPSEMNISYKLKDTINFELKIINENAGHRVPTGDPERFIMIYLNLMNEMGDTLETKIGRIGETWQWHPKAIKLSDNNLYPLEERLYKLSYLPKTKDELHLSVIVNKHRISDEALKYNNLGSSYPAFINIYKENFNFIIK